MTNKTLKQYIKARFPSRRAFIAAFNEAAGFDALEETNLSRQLAGRVSLSNGWGAAYALFFGDESQQKKDAQHLTK